jgi:hypothetical protein
MGGVESGTDGPEIPKGDFQICSALSSFGKEKKKETGLEKRVDVIQL